ncbi:MAG: tRNA epoxyqueuosine(34) reductase QueG [Paraprevotella sp.]|nr:tRNA epoxyqueuosine(34) reductase QueG [Paraprevotella sp.]
MTHPLSACGLAPAHLVDPSHASFFRQWISQGRQAEMSYLARHEDKRLDPRLLVEGCHTVVSVALNYYPTTFIPEDRMQIAWYAYGKDYHEVMRNKMQMLLIHLQQLTPSLSGRAFCDTAPILERYWAWRCGIGWIGRHTQLIIPHAGSTFFLGELFLSHPADRYDTPIAVPHCGNCKRCVEACPTHALSMHEGLDARRCLSYLTIENRGEIPPESAPALSPYIYGCDRCLKACPHLRFAQPTQEEAFTPRPELRQMTNEDWMQLDIEHYRTLFKGSAVKRAKYSGLMRNLYAMNSPTHKKK